MNTQNSFRMNWLDLLAVQGTLKSLLLSIVVNNSENWPMVSMSVLRLVVWQPVQNDDYLLGGEYICVE